MDEFLKNFNITPEEACLAYLAIAVTYATSWFLLFSYHFYHKTDLKRLTGSYSFFQFNMIFLIYGVNCQPLWASKVNIESIFPIYNVFTHGIGTISAMVFTAEFLKTSRYETLIRRIRYTMISCSLIAMTASFKYPNFGIKGMYIIGLVAIGIIASSIYECFVRDRITGIIMGCAWSVMLTSVFFYILANLGVTPTWFVSRYCFLIGSLFEMLIFSIALVRMFHQKSRDTEARIHDVRPTLLTLENWHNQLTLTQDLKNQEEIIQKIGNVITYVKETLVIERQQEVFQKIYIRSLLAMVENYCMVELERRKVTFLRDLNIPEYKQVYCLPYNLARAISNLIINGAQACQNLSNSWVKLDVNETETTLIFSVTDSGNGIKPEDSFKLFTHGFSTKPSGTGTGLTIAKRVAKLHKGRVFLDTRASNTKFVLEISNIAV